MQILTQDLIRYIQKYGFSKKELARITKAIESWHKDHAVTIWTIADVQNEAKLMFDIELSPDECRDILDTLQRKVSGGITWTHIDAAIENLITKEK